MAKLILRDASVVVNGVDLSTYVKSVEIKSARADEDTTTMGAQGKGRLPGLKDESITVTWRQDFAAAKVDATLWPLYDNGTSHTVVVKPTSAAVSATNPTFTATCYLLDYAPISGDVGSVLDAQTTFSVDGVIVRATA